VIAMGLKIKNPINYDLMNGLDFFSIPLDEEKKDNYESIKNKIYTLDMDSEDKAAILNSISTYNTTKSTKEKNRLKKEIEAFIKEYEL